MRDLRTDLLTPSSVSSPMNHVACLISDGTLLLVLHTSCFFKWYLVLWPFKKILVVVKEAVGLNEILANRLRFLHGNDGLGAKKPLNN